MTDKAMGAGTDPRAITRRGLLTAAGGAGLAAMAGGVAGGVAGPAGAQTRGAMATRKIPSTGEALPVVGFGTYRSFNLSDTPENVRRLAEVCSTLFAAGGSILDSSPMYDRAEEMAGKALGALKSRDKAFIMTKVWTTGRERGIRQMRESLRLFRTDKIELMQVHNLSDWRTQLKTLRAWKDEGVFRYIGLTHYTTSALDDLMAVARREKVDFLQFPYSIDLRAAERRLLPFARDTGIATIANVPFGQGGLFREVRGKTVPDWAAAFGADSWARFFLKYVLGDPALTCVIPGTGKPHHARDNVGAGFGRVPTATERRRMIAVVEAL